MSCKHLQFRKRYRISQAHVTLARAEVARCGKTLSPAQWLEKRLAGELKVTVAGGRVVGNSFVAGAGAPRRQFVVAGDRRGCVRHACGVQFDLV